MRKITFRAWDGDKKEWVSSDRILSRIPMSDDGELQTVAPWYTLMQFTGLQDKNGKEIYEGDVLTFIFPNNRNKGTAPVVWEYGCWNVTDFKNDAGSNNIYNLYPATDCEIIGNIYENPELLTK